VRPGKRSLSTVSTGVPVDLFRTYSIRRDGQVAGGPRFYVLGAEYFLRHSPIFKNSLLARLKQSFQFQPTV
jgi:hypothetical protein